jgi:AraC family transcriptional regulator, positive regulator of tynA and feaB
MLVEATDARTMQPLFATTAHIPVREKFAYWHDVVSHNLMDLDYQLVGDRFDATFRATPIGDLHLCRIEASPHQAERSNGGISRSTSADLVFNFVLSGSLTAEQDDRVAHLRVGDGALCDAERPYRLRSDVDFDLACIRIPRQIFASRVGHLQRLSACNFSDHSELASMVFVYLSGLVDRAPTLGEDARLMIGGNFAELLVAMVAEFAQAEQPSLSEYRGLALMRVKAIVERSLSDAKTTPATIAAELKLSQRYINQLLEAEGTSLSRYIWTRRLDCSEEQLRNSALRGRSVSQIAMDNGFNDLSHFSKAFRNRFGAPPRDYRRACLFKDG